MFYFQYSASQEGSTWIDSALVLSSTLFSLLGSLKFAYILIFYEVPSEVRTRTRSDAGAGARPPARGPA
jgi:hypothetical protein